MRQRRRSLLSSAVLAICVSGPAAAADPLGLYVGGSIGWAQVAAQVSDPFIALSDRFKKNHFAFKVVVGLRPISLFGAELSYMDFGHPRGTLFAHTADASMRGVSAFGILYLPVPVIEVFAKAGVAHIQSATSGFAPNPNLICIPELPCGTSPFQLDRTNTSFAAGAGAQLKFGPLSARAEYERFNAAGENPYLLSLGLTWSFF
jgi:opacity protein-like surface antigen